MRNFLSTLFILVIFSVVAMAEPALALYPENHRSTYAKDYRYISQNGCMLVAEAPPFPYRSMSNEDNLPDYLYQCPSGELVWSKILTFSSNLPISFPQLAR